MAINKIKVEADIGVIGLGVMGKNLVLNMVSKGYRVAVFNRTIKKTKKFGQEIALRRKIIGTYSIKEFVRSLQKPRKIFLMVEAGKPVDEIIKKLVPWLRENDIIIDGGNSNYKDTEKRVKKLEDMGIFYIGMGISGGEEGALTGPSMMPGGSKIAWLKVKKILEDISAKYHGEPCCRWIGSGGSGHFVKMVHNGIEYGDMQLIAETYQLMLSMGMNNDQISAVFKKWNSGKLKSYLIEITAKIFQKKEKGEYLIDKILDTAGQKGTGRWAVMASLEYGTPLTVIAESVFARILSSFKKKRLSLSKKLKIKDLRVKLPKIKELEEALWAAKIISYAQGFELMKAVSEEKKWNLNYSNIAEIWRAGCIIRSLFLGKIATAFKKNKQNLLVDNFFLNEIVDTQKFFRKVIVYATEAGIPVPAMSSALAYFDGLRSARLPANIIQAQRDFFGAHKYERIDKKRGRFYHANWTE